jgi:hypothetical protein
VPIPSPPIRHCAWVSGRDLWNPADPENKQRTRFLQGDLRTQLLRWDPIGIAGAPEAQDEYDCLISPLMHRLHEGASERAIAKWLVNELETHFGLRADRKREKRLAHDLVEWWRAATTRP